MLDLFFLGYIHFFGVLLPALTLAIIALGAARAGYTGARLGRVLILPAVVLGLWFAAAMALSKSDIFSVPDTLGEPPVLLMFLFGGAALLWGLARLTQTGRRISDGTDTGMLAAFQIPRVMGGVFLLGWAAGLIPWQFALPAGLGDILTGILAYRAWSAVRSNAPDARRKLIVLNIVGICDFVVAVMTGVLTSEGFGHVWALENPNIINAAPLVMFPVFFVPLFLTFHLVLISHLRQGAGQVTSHA